MHLYAELTKMWRKEYFCANLDPEPELFFSHLRCMLQFNVQSFPCQTLCNKMPYMFYCICAVACGR